MFRLTPLTLLPLLLLLAPSSVMAKEGRIDKSDLAPRLAELDRKMDLVRQRQMKPELVLEEARRATREPVAARERAIRQYLLGQLLMRLGLEGMKDARAEYKNARESFPDFPDAFVQEATLAAAMGEVGIALSLLDQVFGLDSDHVPAILLLARIALTQKDYERARKLCERVIDIEMTGDACELLATACARLAEEALLPAERDRLRERAIAAAEAWIVIEPQSGRAHLFRASMFHDLGAFGRAARALEESMSTMQEARFSHAALRFLLHVHTRLGQMAKVREVLDRLLACEEVTGEEREQYARMRSQVEGKGELAVGIWQVEKALEVVKNDGVSPTVRRDALKELLGLLTDPRVASEDRLKEMREEILRASFRVLVDAPPEVAIEMMVFFRTALIDPRIVRILVHYVYPYGNDRITAPVRVEAIRTIAEVGGLGALPTLLHSLKDDSGAVQREADRALGRLCEVRSVAGDGLGPLTLDESKAVRRAWRSYIRSEEGDRKLVEALETLESVVDMDPARNRSIEANPIADHITGTLLLDRDARWNSWSKAYAFLTRYLGREFRPVQKREQPITPQEREAAVTEIERFWNGKD